MRGGFTMLASLINLNIRPNSVSQAKEANASATLSINQWMKPRFPRQDLLALKPSVYLRYGIFQTRSQNFRLDSSNPYAGRMLAQIDMIVKVFRA